MSLSVCERVGKFGCACERRCVESSLLYESIFTKCEYAYVETSMCECLCLFRAARWWLHQMLHGCDIQGTAG